MKMTNFKRQLFHRQRKVCFYCGQPFKNGTHGGQATVDHVEPQSLGDISTQYPENMVLACLKCNRAKADMTLIEFVQWIKNVYKNVRQEEITNKEK